MSMLKTLARLRVPLGFVSAALALWLARPTTFSITVGMAVAACGEAIRIWAAGHLEKGREITRSGPYRWVRHPLYVGSSVMGAGFVLASRSLLVAALVAAYLIVTLTAAIRTEEALLDARFDGEYSAYREGRAPAVDRAFSLARVRANREYRAALGVLLAIALLWWRSLA
jgi:protein-S-isoprenylcysteine O-methyltransferase Ste14